MIDGWTIVLDVGKTNAKLSLWDERGRRVDGWQRANRAVRAAGYRSLDVGGIEAWLLESLAACSRAGPIKRIVPVGHGAAAAIVRDGRLLVEPMDYEEPIAEAERDAYSRQRDPFSATGSPLLPSALNLGMQLHRIESLRGPLPADAVILPWPQYWAWRLSGVMASERTSLGCHSDLWRPFEGVYSRLADARGWAERMAPLRPADAVLGVINAEVASATGLPADCGVLCGLHDSNAALHAAPRQVEIAGHDATVLSTGTWFVAMRSLSHQADFDPAQLEESRDCLINVDIRGRVVPSARFMGGREAEIIRRTESSRAPADTRPAALLERLPDLLARRVVAWPSFVPGVGPFPDAVGTIANATVDPCDRQAVASLYLAMMTDTMLGLIGSTDRLVIEGRFAGDELFVRALASLRPQQTVFTCSARDNLAYGALRLVAPDLAPRGGLTPVDPLGIDLQGYADDWRSHAGHARRVA